MQSPLPQFLLLTLFTLPSFFSTVTPGQLPTVALEPVIALNNVVLPQLGFPTSASLTGLSSSDTSETQACLPEPVSQGLLNFKNCFVSFAALSCSCSSDLSSCMMASSISLPCASRFFEYSFHSAKRLSRSSSCIMTIFSASSRLIDKENPRMLISIGSPIGAIRFTFMSVYGTMPMSISLRLRALCVVFIAYMHPDSPGLSCESVLRSMLPPMVSCV